MEAFKIATNNSILPDRMLDREFILRYIAFKYLGITQFKECDASIEVFLNKTMEFLNECSKSRLIQIKRNFENAMDCAYQIFGDYAFRRISGIPPAKKNPINVALFESWSVALSELNERERKKLVENRKIVLEKFASILKNHTYSSDINTAKYNSVKRRLETIVQMIQEVLKF